MHHTSLETMVRREKKEGVDAVVDAVDHVSLGGQKDTCGVDRYVTMKATGRTS